MRDGEFEWDDAKSRSNLAKHDVSFELARRVFEDPNHVELPDDDPDEQRWNAIGTAEARLLFVVFAERNGRVRIISARKANKNEQVSYFADR